MRLITADVKREWFKLSLYTAQLEQGEWQSLDPVINSVLSVSAVVNDQKTNCPSR